MQQKALDKGVSRQCRALELIALLPITIGEADLPIAGVDDAVIGDGYTMRVTPEILDNVLRTFEGPLGVDDPVLRVEVIEQLGEARFGTQVGCLLVEAQRLGACGLLEGLQKLAPEDLAQGFDWEEKLRMGRHPVRPVLGERPTGDKCVEMEVRLQQLIPGMEDHDGTELTAQVLPAKLEERGTGGAKEQAKQEPFIAQDQRIEGMREGQDRVKVGRRQEFRTPGRYPVGFGDRLTLRAVTVTARVVGIALEAALRTLLRVAPELRRATGHDGVHHFDVCR
jgi:hypothetical protein